MLGIDLLMSDDLTQLLSSIGRYLERNPVPQWRALADDIGLMGIGLSEADGGTGGGGVDRAAVAAALAVSMVSDAWLPHAVGTALLGTLMPGHALLLQLAQGSQRIALWLGALAPGEPPHIEISADSVRVNGTLTHVAGGAVADWLLLIDEPGIVVIELATVRCDRRERLMFDGTMVADFDIAGPFTPAATCIGADAASAANWATNALLAGRCAELCALMHRMIEDTTSFLNQRKQFGRALSDFQVLRHRVADMAMAHMKAAALTEIAVEAENGDGLAWTRAVAAACVEAGDAARIVGEGAVQLHGAMGLTEELSLGQIYKRTLTLAASLGRQSAHMARHAALAA